MDTIIIITTVLAVLYVIVASIALFWFAVIGAKTIIDGRLRRDSQRERHEAYFYVIDGGKEDKDED